MLQESQLCFSLFGYPSSDFEALGTIRKGGKGLKKSAVYPAAYGQKIASTHRKYIDSFLQWCLFTIYHSWFWQMVTSQWYMICKLDREGAKLSKIAWICKLFKCLEVLVACAMTPDHRWHWLLLYDMYKPDIITARWLQPFKTPYKLNNCMSPTPSDPRKRTPSSSEKLSMTNWTCQIWNNWFLETPICTRWYAVTLW